MERPASLSEQDKARAEEQRRFVAINAVRDEGLNNLDRIVATERAAADQRVRDAVNEYARRYRQATSNPGIASAGPTITDPIGLLAELLGELDGLAEIYAGTATPSCRISMRPRRLQLHLYNAKLSFRQTGMSLHIRKLTWHIYFLHSALI